ncbi:MAG: DUF5916 domain-containing protein [Gemmatimonadota bacterium]
MIAYLLTTAALLVGSRAGGVPKPPPTTAAQSIYSGRANQLKVRPPRLDDGTSVDGQLDEAQWANAALLTGFSQFAPNDGTPSDDSTEVLVWYSPTAIHFGIRAFERHGLPRATLADRDKIGSDDNVQILLGTFNDGRQATVFAVNPFGVQGDGTIVESNVTRTNGFGGAALARDPADLSPDFVFQSKGRVTSDGYVVEVRIPFKSLKYQSSDVQSWGLNVVRQVQHSGHEDSWTPARRAGLSFLAQSGVLEGLTELHRGLVVDVNPEVTQRTAGGPPQADALGGWRYDRQRPQLGGNARWGITNNLTLNGTVKPDFSQIESDAGQLLFDPRQALYFAEKRPFFLDGAEQFATPHSLIYTRRIVKPVGAAKLSGKLSGTSIAFLSAVDDAAGSLTSTNHPVFNLLRVQRDVGASSKLGVAYTDRVDGANYNRVADVDGSYLFGSVYSFQGQYAQSYTKQASSTLNAPLWHAGLNRNGKHFAFSYALDGVHEDFIAQSGFINRTGVVNGGLDQRFTHYGAPGSLIEALTFNPAYYSVWRYQSFVHQDDAIEKKLHLSVNSTLRGGWNAGVGYFVESYGFDPGLYSNYRVQSPSGVAAPFVGTPRLPNSEQYISLNTPQGGALSASAFYLWGRDENFYEWASSRIVIATYGLTYRPTDKLRLNATYNLQSYNRPSDGSIVANNRIPRLKLEYQLARPLFVRLVGEYGSFYRDALRDEGRTGRPLLVNGSLTTAATSTTFRGDFLFAYQPNPGTVVFLGYGAGYRDSRTPPDRFEFPSSLGFEGYNRTDDALFVKASYLLRL